MLLVKPIYLLFTLEHHENPSKKVERGDRRFFELQEEEEEKVNLSADNKDNKIDDSLRDDQIKGIGFDKALRDEAGIDDEHSFSEIFIHQLIETIEFVLGTVSNTASYLRLWALSLAHSQLSAVFYDKLIEDIALSGKGNGVVLFLVFPIWASFTFFVLM